MQIEHFAILLAVSGCSTAERIPIVSDEALTCAIVGPDAAGAVDYDVCAMLVDAARRSGHTQIARIELSSPSKRSAVATAYDAEGAMVTQLNLDVSDATMRPAIWQAFARDFGEHLTNLQNR